MVLKELNHSDILGILPNRKAESHKGDYGKILLLCGSRGYTGAAALAAMGALRCGAGLVYLGVPESIYAIEASKLLEPVVLPLPDKNGVLSAQSVDMIMQMLPDMDAVLLGPGLGKGDGIFTVIKTVLEQFQKPVVVDADGINVLAGHIDLLRGRTAPTTLTPHMGEFRRLIGQACEDRVAESIAFAADNNVILLLKGHRTVITDGTVCYVNNTGNPGMAVGGSGDVLAGIIVALLGQGIDPLEAAACGAWLHGAAGDICEKEIGQYGMLPSDILRVLPRLLK